MLAAIYFEKKSRKIKIKKRSLKINQFPHKNRKVDLFVLENVFLEFDVASILFSNLM